MRVYSRAHDDFFFCFLRSNDRTKTGVCLLSFLLQSLRLTKTVLKTKRKGLASALPASVAGSSYLSSSKVKNKDHWTTNGIDRTVSVEQTERPSSPKLELKERAIFPLPLMVQDFDRLSNPNCPFNHAQANLTTPTRVDCIRNSSHHAGVNNDRFPSPKTKPCEKLKKSFLFAFDHSLFLCSFFFFFYVSY